MCADDCRFVYEFPGTHKIAMRFLMIAFIVVGAYAVFLHNWAWGWIYVAVVVLGQAILVLPNLCAHCPYPHEHNDCLLIPAGVVRKLIPYRGPEIGRGGRLAMAVGGRRRIGDYSSVLAFQGTAAATFVLGCASPIPGLFYPVSVQTLSSHRLSRQSRSCEMGDPNALTILIKKALIKIYYDRNKKRRMAS